MDADGGTIGRNVREAFAKDGTEYTMTGKARSNVLQKVFDKLRKLAMQLLGKDVSGLTEDKVRAFDNLFQRGYDYKPGDIAQAVMDGDIERIEKSVEGTGTFEASRVSVDKPRFVVDISSVTDEAKRLEEFLKLTDDQKLEYLSYDSVTQPSAMEFTKENYDSMFGEGRTYSTPEGPVRMGEHQYEKLKENRRGRFLSHIPDTLTSPSAIFHGRGEDAGKRVFVKAHVEYSGDSEINKYFNSITVDKDGEIVAISNFIRRKNSLRNSVINKYTPTWINGSAAGTPTSVPNGGVSNGVGPNIVSVNPKVNGTFQLGTTTLEQVKEQLAQGGYPPDSELEMFKDDPDVKWEIQFRNIISRSDKELRNFPAFQRLRSGRSGL